ncbi:hypothetical protein [Nocardia wallacei]|uniref:hypothetical protein n=1 Tax=Nocardia wallacei TaxID=480035 RepID=UPI002457E3BB|nr:hypothetical protein [Nocardia wallacei]
MKKSSTQGSDDRDAATVTTTEPGAHQRELDRLAEQIGAAISATAPDEWRWDAVFVLTTSAETAEIVCAEGDQVVRVEPPESVWAAVRRHREISARLERGPWWRLLLWSAEVGPEFHYDFGAEPFPEGQLFAPEVYRADLRAYPRSRLPVWLAAYIGHHDRQVRSPRQAVAAARADRAAGAQPIRLTDELPNLPVLWARWAVLSAAFVAVGSDRGPRILPSLGRFESPRRHGSTLYLLPPGRAVLSGGVWDSPMLDAVYNDGAEMPKLYAGAPDWVTDPVLNRRAAVGLLSFCYWWDGEAWYRGESPSPEQVGPAVPGVWSAATVAEIVKSLLPEVSEVSLRSAVDTLLAAAQVGAASHDHLVAIFGDPERFDIDGALSQLTLSGAATATRRLPMPEALERVRAYILERDLDTTDYPLSRLTATRIGVGWAVSVPASAGEIVLDRAVFYVADDGVVERSSASIAAEEYAPGFERRYRQRLGVST